jgi:hypothetical protein
MDTLDQDVVIVPKKEDEPKRLQCACHLLEMVTMKIFVKHGRRFSNRLSF